MFLHMPALLWRLGGAALGNGPDGLPMPRPIWGPPFREKRAPKKSPATVGGHLFGPTLPQESRSRKRSIFRSDRKCPAEEPSSAERKM